jgi:hypothetical protein
MTDLPPLALSIRQPWAWAIIHAGKDIENRDWRTQYRGPVCIHAAKGMTRGEWDNATGFMDFDLGLASPLYVDVMRGGIIGVADLVDCVEASESPWFFGRYGFVLRNARPVDFIPAKGALGIFKWKAST